MNNKGMTMLEFIVSLALISIVMVILFNLLIDVQYMTKNSDYAKDNQLNRASILRTVMDDFVDNHLVGINDSSENRDTLKLEFTFYNGEKRTLTVEKNMVSYNGEKWSMKSQNTVTYYKTCEIPYSFYIDSGSHFFVRFRIPVVIGNQEENTMDDLDFFYVGDKIDIEARAFEEDTTLLGKSCS